VLESKELAEKRQQKLENERKRKELQAYCTEKMKAVMLRIKMPDVEEAQKLKLKAVRNSLLTNIIAFDRALCIISF
jgi:phosphoenolpyruvate carboxylase